MLDSNITIKLMCETDDCMISVIKTHIMVTQIRISALEIDLAAENHKLCILEQRLDAVKEHLSKGTEESN